MTRRGPRRGTLGKTSPRVKHVGGHLSRWRSPAARMEARPAIGTDGGYSLNTSSPKRDGTCGQDVVFWGSDQMLMRRFGSTPSHRLTFAFHTAPAAGGRRDSSSKFGHGIATSRLHPLSTSFESFSVPRTAVAIVTPVASKRLKS